VKSGHILDATRESLLQGIRSARSEVLIAAPFISLEATEQICKASLASTASRLRLLTALNRGSVRGGFLSSEGLQLLFDCGFEIRSARNLHAKVALIDGKSGIIGSGNFTTQGLGGKRRKNLELGVQLSRAQAASSEAIINSWWTKARPVTAGVLAYYSAVPPVPKGSRASDGGFGPFVFDDEEIPPKRSRGSTGYWLKMLYHHTRSDQANWWRSVEWVSDGRPPPSLENKVGGPQYEIDDLLVFYLVELGGPVRCCPAIARVTKIPRHDPKFVSKHGFPGDEKQWPWVTEVEMIDSTTLEDAPGLEEIGVSPRSTERKGRLKLGPGQFASARTIIAGSS
jgi:hypothetical protein